MIDGTTKIYGILGRPVEHSLSPAMHNAAFRELGLNAVYVAFPVTDLRQAVAGLRGLSIRGASVTIPFKEEIIPLLDAIDPQAARMGAVNTVVNREGLLKGYNTDSPGAVAALKEKTAIAGNHFLILGAGGASRAILFGILEEGGRVSLTDIDAGRALALAAEFGVEALAPHDLSRCQANILINATPVGMAPQVDDIPINPELLGRFTLVMDIVYRPLKTRLLREAADRNCRIIDGLKMLIYQGAAQFELWTGQKPPVEVMARAAYDSLRDNGTSGCQP
ncbi:MAG: shikimate dehydrogenase [Deltaproteobacteria bacterium]|nr:shikimate dehydrogenase [Deltaproteobacteria bacterium]